MRGSVIQWIAPVSVLVIFILFSILYQADPAGAYRAIIDRVVYGAGDFPFLDTHVILSWIECHRLGVDVFTVNPCDIFGRTVAQSPLWLALSWTGLDVSWTNMVGMAQNMVFVGALFFLPRAHRGKDALLLVAAYCSPAVAYALERGNTDLLMFVAALCTALLAAGGGRARICAYAIALLAGLLKFYPLASMIVAIRESPGRLLGVAALSVVVMAIFVMVYADDLPRIAYQFGDYPFALNFGAINIVAGLAALAPDQGLARAILVGAMIASAVAIAIRMALRIRVAADLERMNNVAAALLLVGAALIVGSFFTTTNRSYRAIFLIMVIHGLLALYRETHEKPYKTAAFGAVFLLWFNMLGVGIVLYASNLSAVSQVAFMIVWLLGQIAWWWFIAVLSVFLIAFVSISPVGRITQRLIFSIRAPRGP